MLHADLTRSGYGAILADPPWAHSDSVVNPTENALANARNPCHYYPVMSTEDIAELRVGELAAPDSLLFMWCCWPLLIDALVVMEAWGFEYVTCAFDWTKAYANQIEMFREDYDVQVGMGWWTRSNTEVCLLGKRGNPVRLNADVRQAIVEPRREHSRKPDCVYERIERLCSGPYLELFARTRREGWDSWGNEIDKFKPVTVAGPIVITRALTGEVEIRPSIKPLPGQLSLF